MNMEGGEGANIHVKQGGTDSSYQRQNNGNNNGGFWRRLFIFCCDDQANEIGKPEVSSMPDMSQQSYRPIHGQHYQDGIIADGRRQSTMTGYEGQGTSAASQMLISSPRNGGEQLTRSERLLKEDVRCMLILLEHYKLQLTLFLPKVCLVVRKAQKKGKNKLEETLAKIQKSIDKVRLGEINEWGPKYNCNSEAEFQTKLKKYNMIDKDIQVLDLQIKTAISNAMNGSDPEIVIQLDDSKLNLETYQQIIQKVYAVIRHRVYQEIQKKIRQTKSLKRSKTNLNDSMMSTTSLALGEDDLTNLIKDLDIEEINREVFKLYDIQYGLDTTLALRKVQVVEAEDEHSMDYLECLKEAHDQFLSYIFQGYTFGKMQQNPIHSTDQNYGVPKEYNDILDELLESNGNIMNEEEYKMQMNASLSMIAHETSHGGPITGEEGQTEEQQRILTEVDENQELAAGSQYEKSSSGTSRASAKYPASAAGDNPLMSQSPQEDRLHGGAVTTRNQTSKRVQFGAAADGDDGVPMVFPQSSEEQARTKSFAGRRRQTEKGLRPVSVTKKELANKFTAQAMGKGSNVFNSKRPTNKDASLDKIFGDK